MKQKPHWNRNFPPHEPTQPRKPDEFWVTRQFQTLSESESEETTLAAVMALPLPDGITHEQLVIQAFGDDYSQNVRIGYYVEVKHLNSTYKSQMKRYEKQLATYEADLETWKQDHKEWTAWNEGHMKAALNKQLAAAEKLLREHGRLK
jgi:hypothetical protein